MLNLQWVIKRPQLEKRSAWISIYLLINSESAFINFSPGPQPGLRQPPMNFKCAWFSTDQHYNLALCFVENFIKRTWMYLGMCQGMEAIAFAKVQILKNEAHAGSGVKSPLCWLRSHTWNKTCPWGQHWLTACAHTAVTGLLESFLPLYQTIHN